MDSRSGQTWQTCWTDGGEKQHSGTDYRLKVTDYRLATPTSLARRIKVEPREVGRTQAQDRRSWNLRAHGQGGSVQMGRVTRQTGVR